MCGRFNNHLPKMHGWAEMLGEWQNGYLTQSQNADQIQNSYNVTPSSTIAAFANLNKRDGSGDTRNSEGYDTLAIGKGMRWGMIPSWSKSFDSKYATFNARLESVAEKATFRSAWKKRQRCLIPMAGYYEWQAARQKGRKQPFYITDLNVGGLVAAGLYERWEGGDGENYSCTMITRPADLGLDKIHHRMPVLLGPRSAQRWFSWSADEAQRALLELDSPDLVYWPVDKAVGNVRNDHAELCKAIDLTS